MKKYILTLIITASLLLATTPAAQAAVYYVDFDNGNDTEAGTSDSSAWKHCPGDIEAQGLAASAGLSVGDTVLFKGGVRYKGVINFKWSGSVGNHITYKGDGWPGLEGKKAIIDGSEPLTGWVKCSLPGEAGGNPNYEKIYYVNLPYELDFLDNTLYQNDKAVFLAQYPNPPSPFEMDDNSFYLSVPAGQATSTTLVDPRLGAEFGLTDLDFTNASIFIWRSGNLVDFRKINSFEPATGTITFDTLTQPPYTDRDTQYSLVNSPNKTILDRPGEFYIDLINRKLFLWPYDETNPNTAQITISLRSNWNLGRNECLTIEGFRFTKLKEGAIKCSSARIEGYIIRNNEMINIAGNSTFNACIYLVLRNNVVVEGNYLENIGGMRGIALGGENITVRKNTLINVGRTGIYAQGGNNIQFLDNLVLDSNGSHSNGISAYGTATAPITNVLIAGNIVQNTASPCTLEHGSNYNIVNNIFSYLRMAPGGAHFDISCWNNCNGALIANNIFGTPNLSYVTNGVIKNNFSRDALTGTDASNNIVFNGSGICTSAGCASPGIDRSEIFVHMPRTEAMIENISITNPETNVATVSIAPHLSNVVKVNDLLIFVYDRLPRTITGVSYQIFSNNRRTRVSFTPPVPELKAGFVEIWPAATADFNKDYRLKETSPARDAGIDVTSFFPQAAFPAFYVAKDIIGTARPQGSSWDIGAYEYVSLTGDLSGDGSVTAYDAALALQLGKTVLEAAGIAQQAVAL